MREAEWPDQSRPAATASGARALVVTSLFERDPVERLGRDAYSYHYVYRAFRPLLERLGTVVEVPRPESRLDYALRQAERQGLRATHLSFLPLQRVYLSSLAPNVAMPFWEFPDLPDEDFADTARNNWARIADRLSGVLCASQFTREAFVRARVRAPVHVVPVPIADRYFELPPWQAAQRGRLECPAHVYPHTSSANPPADHWSAPDSRLQRAWYRARALYDDRIEPRVPRWVDRGVSMGIGLAKQYVASARAERPPEPNCASIELSGVVYTTFVNPFDPRKNWRDLLSAFLLGLRDAADATLVVKLVVSPTLAARGLRLMLDRFAGLGLRHRCRLVFLTDYLSDAQLLELMRCSTFAISASRAEGACLPLQDALAAARPVVAPAHSALAEYVDPRLAFVVDAHPEPTPWPHDPREMLKTTWHRIVWQSLYDQIRASYRVATADPDRYARMAAAGRQRMRDFASAESVLPRLRAALDQVDRGKP